MQQRLQLHLTGIVQGVGFRPFVHRLAHELGLGGWVQNRNGSVWITAEGPTTALDAFESLLLHQAPPLARPSIVSAQREAITAAQTVFQILESQTASEADIHLPVDTHLCTDCRAELFDPHDRRYRYPFINCTQCGPRYTIIEGLPYDRRRTSMANFPLCPACQAEYESPANRRFHAEPVACPVCGPQLSWHHKTAPVHTGEAALQAALAALRQGMILAVRGVGGYHLMADARNAQTIALLRQRKARPSRPFALLFDETGTDGADALRAYLQVSPEELALLQSPQRPILLLKAHGRHDLAAGIAPGMDRIGAMLPHSPLQALLAEEFGAPLVATSGNLSGEPIALSPEEAEQRLGNIADAFLHHDRPILRPAEDGVWQFHPLKTGTQQAVAIRMGRGAAPQEWTLPHPIAEPTLALGGEQKVCIALAWGTRAVMSPHIGDLAHPESMAWLQRVVADLSRLYQVTPRQILLDAHTGYRSHQWASQTGLRCHTVWHHHAHASALAAEYPAHAQWLMLTWDGVGLGPDGSLWGGEYLLGRPGHWQRIARLRPFCLPGGEAASRQCWRSAAGMLWETQRHTPAWHPQIEMLHLAWQKNLNNPKTSAMGRLFDAAAAMLDVCLTASFEGEAPMRLQALAETVTEGPHWPVQWLQAEDGLWELNWERWLEGLQDNAVPVAQRAWALHDALARSVVELMQLACLPPELAVGGAGGVFQNSLLTQRFYANNIPLILPQRQPPNDGSLALGQIMEWLAQQQG